MKSIKSTLLLLLGFALVNCLDPIDLEQGAALPEGIVVQGRLNVDEGGGNVDMLLQRLFRFGNSNRPDQVVTAVVTLENSEGQSLNVPYFEGSYKLDIAPNDPSFALRPGIGYRVSIQTREGKTYETEFDELQEKLEVERLSARLETIMVENIATGFNQEIEVWSYAVTGPAAYADGNPARFRYTLERTFAITDFPVIPPYTGNPRKTCYITGPIGGLNVIALDARTLNSDRLDDYPLISIPNDYRYTEGNFLTVYQEVLSRDAFQYFDQISKIASTDASIFAPPGGPVIGNARDVDGETANVFGFFYVTNRSLTRLGISPDEAGKDPNEDSRCPLPPSMNPNPPPTGCDQCLLFNGSTTDRPDFFEF